VSSDKLFFKVCLRRCHVTPDYHAQVQVCWPGSSNFIQSCVSVSKTSGQARHELPCNPWTFLDWSRPWENNQVSWRDCTASKRHSSCFQACQARPRSAFQVCFLKPRQQTARARDRPQAYLPIKPCRQRATMEAVTWHGNAQNWHERMACA